MKYIIALIGGFVVGALIFAVAMYHNPFISQPTVSPLAVTDDRVIDLSYSAVPADAILYTDHGESIVTPLPDRVAELWEPAVSDTRLIVNLLRDGRGSRAGIGIKFSTASEKTAVIRGEALVDSIWHIYLPDQGTFMVDQVENYWAYLRDIVVPARWSSGKNWVGNFHHIMTVGPGSLGTGRVTGGSGIFANVASEAVESLTARGYSATSGPVSMSGNLSVSLPQPRVANQQNP